MARFTQIHMLTSYPPSNLNRDDLGRPKTAFMGGSERMRVSSQSLKRAWRTSEAFSEALDGHVGIRTRSYGREIHKRLTTGGVPEKDAVAWTRTIVAKLGKNTSEKPKKEEEPETVLDTEQLAHISQDEKRRIDELVDQLIERKSEPTKDDLEFLTDRTSAVDVALFGRMLAASPEYNIEAACQVSHAITVHQATVEDDFFTAVDDLNKARDATGSGHMGDLPFGAGVFYTYLCIDRDRLVENLGGDGDLANRAIQAIVRTATTVSPTGKQNSFASRAFADYVRIEEGDAQPRTLAVAFLKPVRGPDLLANAIEALQQRARQIDQCYGTQPTITEELNTHAGKGSLDDLCKAIGG